MVMQRAGRITFAIAAAGVAAVASSAACGLIVGEPHGLLPGDASLPNDVVTVDVDFAADASGPDGGVPSDAAAPDGSGACAADLDADPGNCGWCGHDCRGVACTGGACAKQVLALSANPTSMTVDGPVLYMTTTGAVQSFDLRYATLQTLVYPQNAPKHIVAHSPYVFWTTAEGQIHRAGEDGGAPTILASNHTPGCLAANGTFVYWSEASSGNVYRVPVDSNGGAIPDIAYPGSPGTVCVNANDRTLAILTPHSVVEWDLDSGIATTAAISGVPDPRYILLGGGYAVVFTTTVDDAGSFIHIDAVKDGTNVARDLAQFPSTNVLAAAADDTGIAFSPQDQGRVDGCLDMLCTKKVQPLMAPTTYTLAPVALDPTYVYVADGVTIEKFAR
jgi:hypothetical protein